MGHEIGHVTANHAAQRMGQQSATSLGLAIASVALGGSGMTKDQSDAIMAVAGAGASVGILLPFSRENESQADILGVDYMHAAGFKPRESVRLWEKMAAAATSRPQEWMSTHPDPNRRAQVLDGYITSKGWA
jgi:predicted Zn-dependent protease